MKNQFLMKLIVITFSVVSQISYAQDTPTNVEPFLPEIVSQFPGVRDLAISPAGNELYFTIQSYLGELSSLVCLKKTSGVWTNPEVAQFSGKYHDLEPSFSPDGFKLFFVSNRPTDSTKTESKDYDIWYVERKNVASEWSAAINIGAPINTKENEFYPSITKSKNLYFTSDGPNSKGKDDIFVSKWVNGKYQMPLSLCDSVNSTGYEFNAFISPNESYLLYTCYNRKNGFGSGDLYISYNKGNDQWTSAKNLGEEINSPQMDYCPFVHVQEGTLYFTSKRSDIKTQFEKRQNVSEILKEMNKYENGQSRLYQTQTNFLIEEEIDK